jgi:hypothetical protein
MVLARFALSLCLPVLLLGAGQALAGLPGSMITPTPIPRQEVFSKNEAFVLVVDPELQRNSVYAASDRTRPLWSFPGVLKSDVRWILLADSGLVVALVGNGDSTSSDPSRVGGVRLIDREGKTRSYDTTAFIEKPPLTYGCGPASVRWFDAVEDRGDRFVIRTADGEEHTLEYTTAPPNRRWYVIAIAGVFCGILLYFANTALRRPPAAEPTLAEPNETAAPA